MGQLNVQFSDSSKTIIVGYFSDPQDPEVFKNQGVVTADDPRWKAYYNSLIPLMQEGMPVPIAS
jgi:hypothetical protein